MRLKKNKRSILGKKISFLFVLILLTQSIQAANNKPNNNELFDLSIEDLMNINVTTVSRRTQKLNEAASAIFVITQDDIKRSGVTSIPEALRMAPGVQVARISTDKWAISIRGFNDRFNNKLQVLMDGRSVYNPLFAGAQWELEDTLVEDIERIEVIRGPGAAMWGANAVNGIINIITKKAADTQGIYLTAGGGSFERGFVGARHGGTISDNTPYRIYVKAFSRDGTKSVSGESAHDSWHEARGGFRLDHNRSSDQITLQGDLFYRSHGERLDTSILSAPIFQGNMIARGHSEGGNIRLRWDRNFSNDSALMMQAYYDRYNFRLSPGSTFNTESFDIDAQYRFNLFDRHHFTWGTNYRLYHNTVFDTANMSFSPRKRSNHLFSMYLHDEIKLIPEQLKFILGTRFDHNDFTGLEIQPNARLIWTPNSHNSIWMSVSRAVRIPSRAENDVRLSMRTFNSLPGAALPLPLPVLAQITGTPSFKAEKLLAYEIGYRHQFSTRASMDFSAFFNDYSQLRDLFPLTPTLNTNTPIHLVLPLGLNNQASAYTYGFEISADSRPTDKWRLQLNYSYLNMHINSDSIFKQFDASTGSADKVSPHHQVSLRSNYDVSQKIQFNLWLRYISSIDFYNIPGYITMDSKLVFKPTKKLELFLVGQNLFNRNHREFNATFVPSLPTNVPRGIYVGMEWRF